MADTFWNLSWPPWPHGAVLFALGVHASERGWLVTLSPRRTRRLGKVAATALAALVALASYGTTFSTGWRWSCCRCWSVLTRGRA